MQRQNIVSAHVSTAVKIAALSLPQPTEEKFFLVRSDEKLRPDVSFQESLGGRCPTRRRLVTV